MNLGAAYASVGNSEVCLFGSSTRSILLVITSWLTFSQKGAEKIFSALYEYAKKKSFTDVNLIDNYAKLISKVRLRVQIDRSSVIEPQSLT